MSMEQLTINNYPIPSKENKKVVVINDLGRIRQKITGDRKGFFIPKFRVEKRIAICARYSDFWNKFH